MSNRRGLRSSQVKSEIMEEVTLMILLFLKDRLKLDETTLEDTKFSAMNSSGGCCEC